MAPNNVSVEGSQPVIRRGGPGVASILAIGTANPDNFFNQADYPDYYFRVTNSEDKTELKEKFKRICKQINEKPTFYHNIFQTIIIFCC